MPAGITRRRLITGAAAMALLAGCDRRLGRFALGNPAKAALTQMSELNDRVEEWLFSPTRLAVELPASAATPEQDFPNFFKSRSMPVAPANWALKIGGMVRHPMILKLEQLQAMPATEMRVKHYCIDGWTAVASWRGVRLSEIARRAGLDPRVRFVEFRSFDGGYWSGWDLASAMHPQTLLAYGMNGHPLMPEHGAPLRVYTAIKLGYKSVKYLTEVNFLPNKVTGYWENRGYPWYGGI